MSFPLIVIWAIVMYGLGDVTINTIYTRIRIKINTMTDIVLWELFTAITISLFTIAPIFYFSQNKDVVPFIYTAFVFMHFIISFCTILNDISVPTFYIVQILSLVLLMVLTL